MKYFAILSTAFVCLFIATMIGVALLTPNLFPPSVAVGLDVCFFLSFALSLFVAPLSLIRSVNHMRESNAVKESVTTRFYVAAFIISSVFICFFILMSYFTLRNAAGD